MSSSQSHGQQFVSYVLSSGRFDETTPRKAGFFTIDSTADRLLGLPTNVKSTQTKAIWMADARAAFGVSEPYRLLIGAYVQHRGEKVYTNVIEALVHGTMLKALTGDITAADIAAFHDAVHPREIPLHETTRARQVAAVYLERLKPRMGVLKLAPKFGREGRRIQCSILMDDLVRAAAKTPQYMSNDGPVDTLKLHENKFGDAVLPFRIEHGPRMFENRPRSLDLFETEEAPAAPGIKA